MTDLVDMIMHFTPRAGRHFRGLASLLRYQKVSVVPVTATASVTELIYYYCNRFKPKFASATALVISVEMLGEWQPFLCSSSCKCCNVCAQHVGAHPERHCSFQASLELGLTLRFWRSTEPGQGVGGVSGRGR